MKNLTKNLLAPRGQSAFVLGTLLVAALSGCSDSITNSNDAIPASIEVPNQLVLVESLGAETELLAQVKDRNGRVIPGVRLVWEVQERGVASVSGQTRLTALNNGDTRIVVRIAEPDPSVEVPGYHSGRLQAEFPLRVRQRAASVQIRVPNGGNVWLWGVGESLSLQALPSDPGGAPLQRVHDVVWSSSNPSIATVDQRGVVTATGEGQVQIRADVEGTQGTFQVNVSATLTFSGCVSSGPMRFLDAAGSRSRCSEDQTIIFRPGYVQSSEGSPGDPS
jgi:hypothetical protein